MRFSDAEDTDATEDPLVARLRESLGIGQVVALDSLLRGPR